MDENLTAFMKVLDSQDNTTGGGTASAIAGAMAGGLVGMVARLSIGKEGMEPEDFYLEAAAKAETLSMTLFDGASADSLAFEGVRNAFRLPKETGVEKDARTAAVQAAWVQAARVPLNNAKACAQVLDLAAHLQGRFNLNAASDLDCARLLARAGLLGCVANVEINLPAIKDAGLVAEMEGQLQSLRARANR